MGYGLKKTRVTVPFVSDSISVDSVRLHGLIQHIADSTKGTVTVYTKPPLAKSNDSIFITPGTVIGANLEWNGTEWAQAADDNWVSQTFYFGSVGTTTASDTSSNIASISVFAGWNHWPLNNKVHKSVRLTYTTSTDGESVAAVFPVTDIPANSSVILRFWPGASPVFKLYAVPLSTGRTNPKTGYYGDLLATYATNISWSGSQVILATLWLSVQQ